MTNDELVIREAIAAEAAQSVDPGTVMTALRNERKPRRSRTLVIAVAGLAVAAGIVGVAVPLMSARDEAIGPASSQGTATAGDTTILLLGTDLPLESDVNDVRPDSIVLVRLGANGSVRAMSLPRDIKVDDKTKLNTVYVKAGGGDKGAQAVIAEVEKITGVRAEHHATVDMTGFAAASSAVGGVEVCLKEASKDKFSNADFPAGKQTISGEQALAFVRQRHDLPNGDLDRITRQQAFLRALVAKLGSADGAKLASLVPVLSEKVRTDRGLDLLDLAKRLAGQSGVATATIPVGGPVNTPSAGSMLTVDSGKTKQFTAQFFSTGAAPTGGSGSSGSGNGPADGVPCVN
nr:LCP family protein [Kibdelosporangium sp. MJ126-NF4]CTQ89412.1 Cell envelope-associated transcriptional attenuator LytR-CpsA-Psr, subfamily A1 (as in PMID19099556) [Kibdelosporangium sp. MJ126-NF4]